MMLTMKEERDVLVAVSARLTEGIVRVHRELADTLRATTAAYRDLRKAFRASGLASRSRGARKHLRRVKAAGRR